MHTLKSSINKFLNLKDVLENSYESNKIIGINHTGTGIEYFDAGTGMIIGSNEISVNIDGVTIKENPSNGELYVDVGGLSGFYIEGNYTTIAYAKANNLLIPGAFYLINDFKTIYDRLDFEDNGSGDIVLKPANQLFTITDTPTEPLVVLAISNEEFAIDAWMPSKPNNKYKYVFDLNATAYKAAPCPGTIVECIDEKNNRTGFNHLVVEHKRYRDNNNNYLYWWDKYGVEGAEINPVKYYTTFTNNANANNYIGDVPETGKNINRIANIVFNFKDVGGDIASVKSPVLDNTLGNFMEYGNNTIQNGFISNNIGIGFENNIIYSKDPEFSKQFTLNTIGNLFMNNIISNGFTGNKIGDLFAGNLINGAFGEFSGPNTLISNTNIIEGAFISNLITDVFNGNKIGKNCIHNYFMNDFVENEIGSNFILNGTMSVGAGIGNIEEMFSSNEIGNNCIGNGFGGLFMSNHIKDQFGYGTLGISSNIVPTIIDKSKLGKLGGPPDFNPAIIAYLSNVFTGIYLGNNFGEMCGGNKLTGSFIMNYIGNLFNDNIITVNIPEGVIAYNNIGHLFHKNEIEASLMIYNDINHLFHKNEIDIATMANNDIGWGFGYNEISCDHFGENTIGKLFGRLENVDSLLQLMSFPTPIMGLGNTITEDFNRNKVLGRFSGNIIESYFSDNIITGDYINNELTDTAPFGENNIQGYFHNNTILEPFLNNFISSRFESNYCELFTNNAIFTEIDGYDFTNASHVKEGYTSQIMRGVSGYPALYIIDDSAPGFYITDNITE